MDKDTVNLIVRALENQDKTLKQVQEINDNNLNAVVKAFGESNARSYSQIKEEFKVVTNRMENQNDSLKAHMSRSEAVEKHVSYLEKRREIGQWTISAAIGILSIILGILAFNLK